MRWDEERGRTLRIKFSHLLLATLQHPIPYPRNPTKAKLTQSRTPVPEPEGEDEQEAKKNAWLSLRTDNRGDRKKESGLVACACPRTTSYIRIRINNTDLRFRPRSSRGPGRTARRLLSSSMPEQPNPWRPQPPPTGISSLLPFLRRRREDYAYSTSSAVLPCSARHGSDF